MDADWSDQIIAERMELDQEFEEKVAASNFTRQQWGLIMTAVEFAVENPDDPERARLVAETSKLPTIIPELENLDEAPGMGGAPGGGSGGSSGGLFGAVKSALGIGGDGVDREQLAAAEEMTQMYADDLQEKLESRGKWERVVDAAAE
jgi:hypothetical protein